MNTIKVAINGFGRIGRLAFRLLNEDPRFTIVAINDLTDAEQLAYLLKYDTGQGLYRADEVSHEGTELLVGERRFNVYSQKDPALLPWKDLGVDVVMECTGFFLTQEAAGKHIEAGAKYVVISAPASDKETKTVVYNVNHNILTKDDHVISAASCTTNCLAPMLNALNQKFGVVRGFMTTVHAFTNDQSLVDQPHRKGILSRRGRAATQNIVPSSTGAAKAIGLVLPELKGKLDGTALRVPVLSGSIVDLTVEFATPVTVDEVHNAIIEHQSETMKFTTDPIVSSDVIGNTHSTVFDGNTTQILTTADGRQLVKVMAWYDNEMGYTAQMVRTMAHLMTL
jgi:glyceraldehyde 3-phosphate dehydrogenase